MRQELVAHAVGQRTGNVQQGLGVREQRRAHVDTDAPRELGEHLRIGSRLADRLDDRLDELQCAEPVAVRDVVMLQERRGRQNDVGPVGRVGHHLVENDGEQVIARQPAQHAVLVGHRRRPGLQL